MYEFCVNEKYCTKSYNLSNKNVQTINEKPWQILEFNHMFLYEEYL